MDVPMEAPETGVASDKSTSTAPAFFPGAKVRFHGLRSKPELNGVSGIIRKFHSQSGRWSVLCGDQVYNAKESHLVFVSPLEVISEEENEFSGDEQSTEASGSAAVSVGSSYSISVPCPSIFTWEQSSESVDLSFKVGSSVGRDDIHVDRKIMAGPNRAYSTTAAASISIAGMVLFDGTFQSMVIDADPAISICRDAHCAMVTVSFTKQYRSGAAHWEALLADGSYPSP